MEIGDVDTVVEKGETVAELLLSSVKMLRCGKMSLDLLTVRFSFFKISCTQLLYSIFG